jgi:putative acetyltransferase
MVLELRIDCLTGVQGLVKYRREFDSVSKKFQLI